MLYKIIYLCFLFSTFGYDTVTATFSTNAKFNGYRKWTPVNSSRDDLYCPEYCYDNPDEDERCCCCEALMCWQLDQTACNITIGQLHVEYTDIYGSAIFKSSGNYTLYEAIHRNGRLTKFPDNLCDFADSLVTLDLSFNRIKNISSIKCLKKLDTLRLDSNEITELRNETFSDMEYLRIVSLSRNSINTIQNKNGNIMVTDISYNIIESIDVTNVVRPGPFCNMSCDGCEFTTQTNELNYRMTENYIHGPGDILLRNTTSNSFLNFSSIGLTDYTTLGRHFMGVLYFDENAIECDCKIYPFLSGLGKDASKYWPRLDINNVTCKLPEHMKGIDLNTLYNTQSFENLTCDLPDCPKGCTCTDNPANDEIKVICKGLTSMPDFTPVGYWNNDNINLDCSDPSNKISKLPNHEYMSRLVRLNLEGNNIRELDAKAVVNLGENIDIDLSGQELKSLPDSFRNLNPNRIVFGSHPIECNCDNVWIGDWIRNNKAEGNLKCSTSRGLVPAEHISLEFLECLTTKAFPDYVPILLGIFVALLILLSAILYWFRYELMLLKRKYFNNRAKIEDLVFDIMLTYCTENSGLFRWIENKIIPALKREGYSLFVPFYDIMCGLIRENVVAEGTSKSRVYVVFLCNKYLRDENSVQEFEIVWKHFTMDTTKNIIVINYDNFETSEVRNRRLRAFVRIRDDINFIERNSKLFDRLKNRLHSPMKNATKVDGHGDLNEEINDRGTKTYYYSEEVDCDVNGTKADDNPVRVNVLFSDDTKSKDDDVVSENVLTKQNVDIGGTKQRRKKRPRSQLWYNRLSVTKKPCNNNCTYRRCYMGPESDG